AHEHVEGERSAPHHRGFDAQSQAAVQPVAFEHFRILVEPPVEPVKRKAELRCVVPAEAIDLLPRDLGRLGQVEAAMHPIALIGVETAADFPEFGHGERGHGGSLCWTRAWRQSGNAGVQRGGRSEIAWPSLADASTRSPTFKSSWSSLIERRLPAVQRQ